MLVQEGEITPYTPLSGRPRPQSLRDYTHDHYG